MQSRAVVLLYHRVVDDSDDLLDYSPSGMTVRVSAFEAQMAYVKQHYELVPLTEIARRVVNGVEVGDNVCCVTFDDGWLDNYTNAFPIIRKHGIPCTIFLATSYIDGGVWFWEERMKYLLAHLVQRHADPRVSDEERKALMDVVESAALGSVLKGSRSRLPARLSVAVTDLRQRPETARQRVLDDLEAMLRLPGFAEPRRFMNWDEVRELERGGVDFGAHTVTHANLERCDAARAETEVQRSVAGLGRGLGKAASLFAYPFGKHTAAVRGIVERSGMMGAFTTRSGFISTDSDPMQMNRINIGTRSALELPYFATRILALADVD